MGRRQNEKGKAFAWMIVLINIFFNDIDADKLLAGRGGVGIYPPGLGRANGWVHVDVRKEKSRWRG